MEAKFTKAIDILYLAKQHDVEIILNGDKLQLKTPKGKTIDKELLEKLGSNKQLIIDFLSNSNWKSTIVDENVYEITPFNRNVIKHISLSFSQERLWFTDRLQGSIQYHLPSVLRLNGNVNVTALSKALRQIVSRHEILRTVYKEEDGQVYQQVKPKGKWLLRESEANKYRENELESYIRDLIKEPFDLSKDDMLRAELIRTGSEGYLLVVTMHHIASDAYSVPILVREVAELYSAYTSGVEPSLPQPVLQYADYAVWQRNHIQGDFLEEKLKYWKTKLDDVLPLELPVDYARPSGGAINGSSVYFDIGADLSRKIQALSQSQEVTLYMLLLAAFKVLMYKYSGQEDICVGTSVANRSEKELDGLIGFFVNTLALRDQVRGDMLFTELLAEVKNTTRGAFRNQEVPFEKVVEIAVKERIAGLSPLFQVMLVLNNTPDVPELRLGDLSLTFEPYEQTTAKFDLTFFIKETNEGLQGAVQYNTGLYSKARIEKMAAHFTELLQSIASLPETPVGKLRILSKEEQKEIQAFERSQVAYPKDKTLADLIEEQATKNPDAIAVAFEEQQLSYRSLNERSNQLAHYLQSKGVKEDTLVPLLIERGVDMLIAILGILKAGGAYVPIDTDFPQDRISYMLEDTKAKVVITSSTASDKLPQGQKLDIIELDEEKATLRQQSTATPTTNLEPQNLAYIIYTSGSTGKPKGVQISHQNLVDYVFGLDDRANISESKSFALVSSIATDLGNTVLYGSLLTGGTLHVFAKETVSHIEALHAYFSNHQVDCLKIVPSHWKALMMDGQPLLPRKLIVFGGEALTSAMVATIQATQATTRIVNHYGPTETTIGKLLHEVNQTSQYGPTIPIGKPFSNTRTYVLSKEMTLCPIGVPGQLYIAGDGLAKGYLNNEALTKEKFVQNPFGEKGELLYATGDKVQCQPDGNILFIGRVDDQVKIRGYRVEPGEIGRILEQSEWVEQAIVLAKEDKQGNKQLVGYIVPNAADYNKQELQAYLKEQLPDYMVPAHLVELESFPLTANGKIDRRALPDPEAAPTDQYTAAGSETETKLKAIWLDVLELDDISVTDDFFELGGHSLLAVRLISLIRKAFGMEIPISEVFDYPTVRQLASRLADEPATEELLPSVKAETRPEYIPLSFSQERMWFIDRLEGSAQYNLPAVLRLKGKLDEGILEKTLHYIIERHEVLRTVIREHEGKGYQQVIPAGNWKLTKTAGITETSNYIAASISKPFDFSTDYMLRAELIKLAQDDNILVVTMHHVASDGWSRAILVKEVIELYESFAKGGATTLTNLPIQYADYAIWQRRYMDGDVLATKLDYWKTKLEDVATLELPADHNRPAIQRLRGTMLNFGIEKELSAAVNKLSQQNGATLYMTLLAAFKVLLYRYSGQEDICVGTTVAGRNQQELEGLIGFFINTMALRSQVKGDSSFKALLKEVKQTTLEAYAHQEVPFEKVVDAVVKGRDMSRHPLFQVLFTLQNTPEIPELKLEGLTLNTESQEHNTSRFDMAFMVNETKAGIQVHIEYNTDLYTQERIQRMAAHFSELLQSAVNAPQTAVGKLAILSKEEQKELQSFEQSQSPYPNDKTIADLFEQQAVQNADKAAVAFAGETISYKDLNEKANQLAHRLRQLGVKEDTLVPLYTARGTGMLTGILGILKAGGAYVPIDTEFPEDRISYMLEDTGAAVVVSSGVYSHKLHLLSGEYVEVVELDNLNNETAIANPTRALKPQNLAYLIYTSGSTGKPKGVEVTHRNLVDYVYGLNERTGISACSSYALVSTIATDLGNTVLYASLVFGGTLHVFTKETVSHIEELHEYFDANRIDCLKIVPSHWKALSPEDGAPLLPAKMLIFGGEALPVDSAARIRNYNEDCRIFNHYGPTETTIGKLIFELNEDFDGKIIPIGKPFSNTRTYVLNKELSLCPIGIPGQLFIAGEGVAKGYLNRSELTAEKFVSNPYGSKGERMYGTGDRVQYLEDGNVIFIGRVDDQVKIRGYRVEPGEIGRVLEQSDLVEQAIVLATEDKQGNKQLVGYVVASGAYDKAAILAYLKEQLPDYMVPAHLVPLDNLPLTANGKIDRKALPDPETTPAEGGYKAPQNETEAQLAAIWQDVLELDEISITDDFFELGGHSLLAVRLISLIRKGLGMELPISDIFDYPTIQKLAERLSADASTDTLPPVIAETRPEHIPLSFSQERLWFIDRLEGSVQYNQPAVLRLKGKLNGETLAMALKAIIDRHEVLRTVILEDTTGDSYQQIMPAADWALVVEDEQDETSLRQHIEQLITAPFDLSKDYMLRANLVKIAEEEYVLVITLHHIASDGWSRSILVKELVELYSSNEQKRPANLPVLAVQYADYSIWQRKYLQGEVLENKLGYWKAKLDNVSPLQLPTDYNRPAIQSTRGAKQTFRIDRGLSDRLQAFSQQNGATLYMTLLSAFKVLLYRYSGQEDICVGTPVAGRSQQEVENLIGFFINTIALRTTVTGEQSFNTLLAEVKATTLEAYSHQEVPFEKVVDAVVKNRDMSRSPLFQVMFSLQNTPDIPEIKLEGLTLAAESQDHVTAKFDISFLLTETAAGILGTVEYSTDIYREETAALMARHYVRILGSVVTAAEQQIGHLEMLTDAEKITLEQFNATSANYAGEKNIVSWFERQAAKSPKAKAIIFGEQELTYKELNDRSNQLAHYLIKKGVKAETLVPVCIERSPEMVIGILAILKAGGAYVPIDPEYPQDRISYMLEDTGAKLVLSSKTSREKLNAGVAVIELDGDWKAIAKEKSSNLNNSIKPDQLAYVIYTSGSTGRPKGVQIEHRSANAFIAWCQSEFSGSKFDIVYATTSICFDLSVFELFYPLSIGKPIRILENGLAIPNYLAEDTAVLINTVPSVVESLLNENTDLGSISVINMAGEPIPSSVSERLDMDHTEVRNLYGPTEDTTYSTIYKLEQGKPVLIGKPIGNTQIHILSKDNQLTPIGVSGEICISGAGLARGYLNQPELTKEKFIKDPFSTEKNAKLYKTGDLGRWLPDGNIEYQGRIDDQVKIRGYRIELGEIETILNQSGLITQSVVLAKEDSKGNKRLVGYVVAKAFDKQKVQGYLNTKLPEYMVPAIWVELSTIPLTPNGKTDKKALPDPELADISTEYAAPRNETEAKLANIWQELLGIEQAGIYDNFFELGGHSLLAMRVLSSIKRELNVELNVRDLFVHPTIAVLSSYLDKQIKGTLLPDITVVQRPEYIPLSFSQERLWFIDRLEGSTQYHLPLTLRLKGNLNSDALQNTLRTIVKRHEALRTAIIEHEGHGYQHVLDDAKWLLGITEYLPGGEPNLSGYIRNIIRKPFNLSTDYMLRGDLINLGQNEHVLVITMHHIASDGWSVSVLVNEVITIYEGYAANREIILPVLSVQYADYAIWQRSYLQGETLENKLAYWKAKLNGVATMHLPTDYNRPLVQSSNGATRSFKIGHDLSAQLMKLSHARGATLYMTLLAAFKVMLHRYSGQEDICVGTPIAGRNQQELEKLIGFFVNTLALRSQLRGDMKFIELLEEIKTTTLEAYGHQEVPFEKVVDAVVKERDMSRNPLFQVLFVLQNTPDIPELHLTDLRLSPEASSHITSKFDISLYIKETSSGIQGTMEYCTDLYNGDTIEWMISHYTTLLESIVTTPDNLVSRLSMLSAAEKETVLLNFDVAGLAYPKDKTIVDWFEEQAIATPAATAIVFEEQQLSFAELNKRSNQLAHYLKQQGIKKEELVPVCIERGPEIVIAILGILKAGGAYVPVDPEYPQDRISYILQDTGAKLALSSSLSRSKLNADEIKIIELDGDRELIDRGSPLNINVKIAPSQLAYVIYTSGSTGRPKGVMIEHRNTSSFIAWCQQEFSHDHFDIVYACTSICFDLSIFELFYPLSTGKPVRILENGLAIADYLAKDSSILINTVPSVVEFLVNEKADLGNVSVINMAGEPVPARLLEALDTTNITVRNLYGPTEDTTYSTISVLQKGKPVTIGKPISNTHIYILDGDRELCPIGVGGEICIGGAGLARGYLNRAELTAEKFVENQLSSDPGARLYKTGDLGRWLPEGNIEYLGRIDDQVKVRGFRIELGEIESVLNELEQVQSSCVVVKRQDGAVARLISFYVVDVETVKASEHQLYNLQVASWKEVYESEYGLEEEQQLSDPEFNVLIWKDSFTGTNIPEEHMREWQQDIITTILAERPGNVLEIGCGSGLIYYPLAGKLKKYTGTDISQHTIDKISKRIKEGQRDYGPTELGVAAAHEIALPADEELDTIIINSVIQYFPGADYLTSVIENSIRLLKGHGRIIIGDVRDNRLLELFKTRLHLSKLEGIEDIKDFKWSIERDVVKEEELCFAPEYFYNLQTLYPEITHIEIKWKNAGYQNELSLYRYSVVLYVGIEKEIFTPSWQNWNNDVHRKNILNKLKQGVDTIAIKDAPNPRLWQEEQLFSALNNSTSNSTTDMVLAIREKNEEYIRIEEVLNDAAAIGYQYRFLLDEDPFKINMLLELHPSANYIKPVYSDKGIFSTRPYTNTPLFDEIGKLTQKEIKSQLQQRLPDYMVPSEFIPLRYLPLNTNGKVDRKFLGLWANRITSIKLNYQSPRSETEQALAFIWQELLGVERAGIYDNFFELGGDSILTIQVVSRMRRLGYAILPKDIFNHQTIARLSAAIEQGIEIDVHAEQGLLEGSFGLLPIQSWYLEKQQPQISHFNQSVLLKLDKNIPAAILQSALDQLRNQHDALRLLFEKKDGMWQQTYTTTGLLLSVDDLQDVAAADFAKAVSRQADFHQRSLSITDGQLMRMSLIQTPPNEETNRLLIVIHHLGVDGVSWRILLNDLEQLINGFMAGEKVLLGNKTSSYRQWHEALVNYSKSDKLTAQKDYWELAVNSYRPLPEDNAYPENVLLKDMLDHQVKLNAEQTHYLLHEVPKAYHTEINDLLLGALTATLCKWSGNNQVVIGLEGHGREEISAQIDTSRSVGWFTSLYPVLLNNAVDAGILIKGVKEDLRRIPEKGLGYGILKFIEKASTFTESDPWDIIFNYLGQLDNVLSSGKWLRAGESRGASIDEGQVSDTKLSINSSIAGGELVLRWTYSSNHYNPETIGKLAGEYIQQLKYLIAHCLDQRKSGAIYTPSDYGLGAEITFPELDRFLDEPYGDKKIKDNLEGLYRLSGLQQGMLFHGLYSSSGSYIQQFGCDLVGVNLDVLLRSWSEVMKRHSILRSAFYYDSFSVPVQCVYRDIKLAVDKMDYRGMDGEEQLVALREYEAADRVRGFDFKAPPLMRIGLLRLGDDRYRMIWTSHHILFDGWSLPVITEEFLNTYDLLISGQGIVPASEDRFEDYIHYLERKNKDSEEQYWREYLSGVSQGTLMPFIRKTAERTKGKGKYQSLSLRLDTSTTARIQGYAQSQRLTISTLMQGVWALLLRNYTGNQEVLYGVVVSGRPDELPGVEKRIGMYINTLVLRASFIEDQPIVNWLQDLQAGQVSSRQFQYTPLQDVQGWTGVKGDLFDSILVFDNYPVNKLIASKKWSLQVENVKITSQSNYPLTIDIGSSDEIGIHFTYNTDLLEHEYITAIRDQFEQVLLQITDGQTQTLNDIRVLTASQEQTLLEEFNVTSSEIAFQQSDMSSEEDSDDNIMSF